MSRARNVRSVATELPASGAGSRPAVLLDVREHLLLGLGEGDAALELGEQPGLLVHRAYVRPHLVERLRRRLHDQVDPLAEDVEIEVGDERGHLDQGVGHVVEAGHLTVDPHQSFVHEQSH